MPDVVRRYCITSSRGAIRARVGRGVVFKRFKLSGFQRTMFKQTAPLRFRMFKRFELFKRGLNIKRFQLLKTHTHTCLNICLNITHTVAAKSTYFGVLGLWELV